MNPGPLLEAHNLTYVPGVRKKTGRVIGENARKIVNDVSLTLSPGEIIGLTGPNGAGKSTLLRLLSGFIRPAEGTILYSGKPLETFTSRERARHCAFMSQKRPDTFSFTVLDIVEMGRYPHLKGYRYPAEEERNAAEKALALLGLDHLAERSFTTLSGGEQQLVFFAQILVQDSPLILLDEPTASLDIGHEAQLLQNVRGLCRTGRGAVIALHNLNSAAEYCDRIILMHEGNIVSQGRPREVLTEEHLKRYYRTDVRLGTNEATGSLVVTALPEPAERSSFRVHLIGGAGSAVALTRELYLLGCTVTGGAAHELDSDTRLWRSLGITCVTVPAFAPLQREDEKTEQVRNLIAAADVTVLCSFPVGDGNLVNLEAAGSAEELVIMEEEGETWSCRRDFFCEAAEKQFSRLTGTGKTMSHDRLLAYIEKRMKAKAQE
jgi:iron complex transport system ATP-binding protein